jgi:hypothetical protein
MKFVCDAFHGRTWFRIETDAEAEAETALMRHAVGKHFKLAQDRARQSYRPGPGLERDIGLKGHLLKRTPLFLTLRDDEEQAQQRCCLKAERSWFCTIIAGPSADLRIPCDAIATLGRLWSQPPRDPSRGARRQARLWFVFVIAKIADDAFRQPGLRAGRYSGRRINVMRAALYVPASPHQQLFNLVGVGPGARPVRFETRKRAHRDGRLI